MQELQEKMAEATAPNCIVAGAVQAFHRAPLACTCCCSAAALRNPCQALQDSTRCSYSLLWLVASAAAAAATCLLGCAAVAGDMNWVPVTDGERTVELFLRLPPGWWDVWYSLRQKHYRQLG